MNQVKPKLLLVDNDPEDIGLFEYAARKAEASFDIRALNSTQELLDYLKKAGVESEVLEELMPRVILLDLNMPGMSGKEALQAIRSEPRIRALPVIIFSSSQWNKEIVDCYTSGANAYVRKPNSLQELVDLVKSIDHFWFKLVKQPQL